MVKRDMNFLIRMLNFKARNNRRNERAVKRICQRRKRIKESSKATFNRLKVYKRKVIFQFFRDVRSNNRLSRNHTSNNIRDIFK